MKVGEQSKLSLSSPKNTELCFETPNVFMNCITTMKGHRAFVLGIKCQMTSWWIDRVTSSR